MSLFKSIKYFIAGDEISRVKEESQQAAVMLLRRDLELSELNERLKKLNNAKGDFIAMAAHQLRTPIATINWQTELLGMEQIGQLNERQVKYVQEISSASEHMAQLIDTLLYISRLELGTNEVHNKIFNLDSFTRHVVRRMSQNAIDKNIEIILETEETELYADQALFDIIMQNLLSNAIKYTPEHGTITVSVGISEPHQTWGTRSFTQEHIVLSVADTGYGIPADQTENIFTRLFRATNVIKEGIGGTGLGLYLVKLVVSKLGGNVWFVTKENEGTTFYVSIPYALVRKVEQ